MLSGSSPLRRETAGAVIDFEDALFIALFPISMDRLLNNNPWNLFYLSQFHIVKPDVAKGAGNV